MRNMTLSSEAHKLLREIIENELSSDYWEDRFDSLSPKEDTILRGCFKELIDEGLIRVQFADNYPAYIQVLRDGYLFESKNNVGSGYISEFEEKLNSLLVRANEIKAPINAAPIGKSIDEHNHDSNVWINDVEIFYNKYLTKHPLSKRVHTILFHRSIQAFSELKGILESIQKDTDFIDSIKKEQRQVEQDKVNKTIKYDLFISHANKDKMGLVEELYQSLAKLGIDIFYDKESIEWGDNWKQRILSGTDKAEFAIIVISNNFFGREWTEIELNQFLNRQNSSGQKLILPILHGITVKDLLEKYPLVADIQAINSNDYSCEEIAVLFAKQLIKRLKSM